MTEPAATPSRWIGAWTWDARPLLRQVDNDLELAAEVVGMFLDDAPAMVAGIRRAARSGDASSLSWNAGVFGTSAAAIGAEAWAQGAAALVQEGRRGSTEEIERSVRAFEEGVGRLERQLSGALGR